MNGRAFLIVGVALAALFWWIQGKAEDRTDATHLAHAADAGTTLMGILATGATEANPLALPMLPVSVWITERERGKCSEINAGYQSIRYGAAANNLAVMAGAFPWSLALMPLVGIPVWRKESEKVVDCKVAILKEVFRNE